jgi:pyruvate/2-oxoglutarate dehydrogenase complex dihydrolipoamide acyltransferase (E2) component
MPHLELERKEDLSSFRKIALGTWRTAYDPSVYGTMELRMEEALRYLEAFRAHTGKRLTVSHMLAKCAAVALKECPDANALLRWNHIYLRKRIGVFFHVVMTDEGAGKADLSGATLYDVEQKTLTQIHDEFQAKVDAVRARKDPALEKTRGLFRLIPSFLIYWVLNAVSFLSYTLNLDLRAFGIPRDPFGSLMITNIGTLGLETAFVPLVPYSRVPILLAVGAVREQPVAEKGRLSVGQVMKISATFDHRFIDGVHAAAMARVLRQWMEHPFEHFDPLPISTEKSLPAAPQH